MYVQSSSGKTMLLKRSRTICGFCELEVEYEYKFAFELKLLLNLNFKFEFKFVYYYIKGKYSTVEQFNWPGENHVHLYMHVKMYIIQQKWELTIRIMIRGEHQIEK